ncbi:ABC transporter substrate-binding protein [Williamsia muralis]|uniref:ABC transporter substrate-binding protein n=1 Tax=Williamsia marianensis TaxID=85044 RepID=UPI001670353B|nr:extracellular solute-binding protein [Williamsia marianensis]
MKSRSSRSWHISGIAVLAAAGLFATACGGSESATATRPSDPSAAALFDAAQEKDEIFVYSVLQGELNDQLEAGYASTYGTPLTIEKIAGSALSARFESEAAANADKSDVVISSDCTFIHDQIAKGTMVSIAGAGVPGYPGDYPAEFQVDEGAVPIVQMNPLGIGYNSSKVNEDDVPTSWDQLIDPKWKGKILMVGPNSSAAQTQMWNYLIESRGESFVKQLAGQAAQFFPSTGPASEALAAGEGDLLIPTAAQVTNTTAQTGAPTAFQPVEETTSAWLCVGLPAKAPNTEGARLFLSYLLSPAGSEALNGNKETGSVGPFGTGVQMPTGYVPPSTVTPELTANVAGIVGIS